MQTAARKKRPAKYPPPRQETEDARPPPSNLRLVARAFYCFEHPDISLAQMNKVWPFNNVSLKTLQNWSSQDRWQERRREAEEIWTARVRAEIGDRIVQDRLDQLSRLERVTERLFERLEAGIEPKSLEGLIHAWVRTCRFLDELREKILDALPENAARPDNTKVPPMDVRLTPDEASAAALTIVRMRREAMRAEARSEGAS